MMISGLLQIWGISISMLVSLGSFLASAGVLVIYALQYNQQERQLEEQHRQLANQEEQLEAQRAQLDKQDQELDRYEQELEELARQTELAEIEHKVYIEVEDYEFEGDRVVVLLSNYGNGVAKNLRLKTTLETDGPAHIKPQAVDSRLRRRDGNDDLPYEGQALRPGEQRVEFEGEAIVGLEAQTGGVHQQSLRGVLIDLREVNGDATSSVSFSIVAESLTEDEESVSITEQPIPLTIPNDPASVSLAAAADRKLRF